MNKAKRFYYAGTWFTLPFRASNYWVEDAERKNVAEAASIDLAMELAKLLNYTAQAQAALKGVK